MKLLTIETDREKRDFQIASMIGEQEGMDAFVNTIVARLEEGQAGSRFPVLMRFFTEERLDWKQAEKAIEELEIIREAFEKMPPESVIRDTSDPQKLACLEPWMSPDAENLKQLFVSYHYRFTYFWVLKDMFEQAIEWKSDIRIMLRDTETSVFPWDLEQEEEETDESAQVMEEPEEESYPTCFLKTGKNGYLVGDWMTLRAFISTVIVNLENFRSGRRFSRITGDLKETGKIEAKHLGQALRELKIIRRELRKLPISRLVWNLDNPEEKPREGAWLDDQAKCLDDVFLTCRGKNLIDLLERCLQDSKKAGETVTIFFKEMKASEWQHR